MQFDDYFAELRKIKLLEPEEEQALWLAYKEAGDESARLRLIESYQPLVFKQAKPYCGRMDIMDILQEGTIGLIEAVEGYDFSRGVAFSLFAVHRIRGRMLSFLKKEGGVDVACMDADPLDGKGTIKENLMDLSPSVAEQLESQELAERLHQAMDRLPAKEREVLDSLYLGTGTPAMLAEQLEVTTAHIYRLQKTGIRRVRGMLSRFMHHW